jgi:hypothetical protein
MSRQREDDLDEPYEVSLGLSDMENDDFDGLASMMVPMTVSAPELRMVVWRKPKADKKNLKLKRRIKTSKQKCPTSVSSLHFSRSLLSSTKTQT